MVNITWDPPINNEETEVDVYEIKIIDTGGNVVIATNSTRSHTDNVIIIKDGNYTIKIDVVNICGIKSEIITLLDYEVKNACNSSSKQSCGSQYKILFFTFLGLFLFFIIIIIISYIIWSQYYNIEIVNIRRKREFNVVTN